MISVTVSVKVNGQHFSYINSSVQFNSSMDHYQCLSAIQRHQSPEKLILSQFSGFMQLQIHGREITLDCRHPGSKRSPRRTSPALRRRLKNDLAGVCILIHSREMSEERKTSQLQTYSYKYS